jgi:Uma2 family endonuclease
MTVNVVAGESPNIRVPLRATRSLAAFREWAGDNDLPEKTRVDYYKGEVWVDMSKEQVWTHGLLKTEIAIVLGGLIRSERLGYYWCNGILVTNEQAEWSGNPDGTFVAHASLSSGRVQQIEGKEDGIVELEGTPDMVLEVVSDGSEKKDNQTLREAYWEAGIPEYWLIDARGNEVEFDILKRGPKGYTATKKQAGWVKSAVFGKSFRLTRTTSAARQPEFTLEVR